MGVLVGMGVAVAVAVGAGVLVKVAIGAGVSVGVAVGAGVSVGSNAALVTDATVGATAGAQAERMKIASPGKTNVRLTAPILLRRCCLAAQRVAFQPLAGGQSAGNAGWAISPYSRGKAPCNEPSQ